jgi:Phage portal protein, SPP1 Gp6-like
MILKEQVLAVTGRREYYQTAEDYYEGDIPEVFATAGLRNAMRKARYDSRLNFCRPVVDAVQNRLEISAVLGTSKEGQAVIDTTWEFNELAIDYNEAHRRALVYGDCYVMVWPDEDGNLEVSYNTPLTTALVYDVEHPRRKSYAVKIWDTEDGARMNLYYPDRIEKYFVKNKQYTEGSQWNLIEVDENPFGEVPVFHFRTMRPNGRPEHFDAYDSQNYINKQFIQSMYVSDFQGAPQRYAVSQAGADATTNEPGDFNEGDTARENAGALKNGPGELWTLKGFSQVGQFQPADPKVFWEPIMNTVRAMASLTSTPLHYFEKTGNIPSGQALRVAEAPLIKKVNDRQLSFGQTWRELFKFVLKINNILEDVQVKWKDVESMDSLERLDAGLKKRNIGLSTAQVMREDGYDEEVIAQVLAEAKDERDAGLAGYQRKAETRVNTNADERNVENNG